MNKFEELNRSHNRIGFDCGVKQLNEYLHNLARQNLKKGLSRTFVLIKKSVPEEILGFYTLSVFETSAEKLPPKFAKKYADLYGEMVRAFTSYRDDVGARCFPVFEDEHSIDEEVFQELLAAHPEEDGKLPA